MSADQNRANSAVSRGGTGSIATPANSTLDSRDGKMDYASGRRDRPDVTRGAEKEGILEKIARTSDTRIGKDTSSKATSISERFGVDPISSTSSALGRAATEVKSEAQNLYSKAQEQVQPQDQKRRSSLMSGRELSNDFLSNYSYEIRSENGEPDGFGGFFDRERRVTDPTLKQRY